MEGWKREQNRETEKGRDRGKGTTITRRTETKRKMMVWVRIGPEGETDGWGIG